MARADACGRLQLQQGSPLAGPLLDLCPAPTPMQTFNVRDFSNELQAPIDKRAQRSAFPPNFIHAIDGAHMMWTAREMRKADMCFAGVHDSYWTHAAHAPAMGRIIR